MATKQKKAVSELTSNQFYGAMNRRFDERLRFLSKFGFRYTQLAEGVAGVVRQVVGKTQIITASTLLQAPPRLYRELVLRQNLRR